MWHAWVRMAVH